MNLEVIWANLPYLLFGAWPDGPIGGAALTLWLSLLAGITSAIIGLAVGVSLSLLGSGWLKDLLLTVLAFFRAIPPLLLIFWIYFLPPVAFELQVSKLITVVSALALIGGAYLAHSLHAGIESLAPGQAAAARALGMKPWQVMRLVLLPQALPMMLPSFINQWIALVKDTSLAYVIGLAELSFVATQVNSREMVYPAEIFLTVAAIYYVFCVSLDVLGNSIARRVQKTRQGI